MVDVVFPFPRLFELVKHLPRTLFTADHPLFKTGTIATEQSCSALLEMMPEIPVSFSALLTCYLRVLFEHKLMHGGHLLRRGRRRVNRRELRRLGRGARHALQLVLEGLRGVL